MSGNEIIDNINTDNKEKHPLEETDSFEEHMEKDIENNSQELKADGSEKIRQIGEMLLSESDIVAKHGTSIKNAMSILKTGLNYYRTTMVVQEIPSVVGLCTYGWKENAIGDAANVVVSAPKSFFKDLHGWDEQEYNDWVEYIKERKSQELVFMSLSNVEFGMLGSFKAKLPKEFVRGCFIYTDGKNTYSFSNNMEKAMDYLTYVDNPSFYENLSPKEKEEFVSKIRETASKKD